MDHLYKGKITSLTLLWLLFNMIVTTVWTKTGLYLICCLQDINMRLQRVH